MNEYKLLITLDDGDQFTDYMDAQTEKQVLILAYWNWEYATGIQIIK